MKELQDAESWQYRGEGAANIVLTYCGDDPELIGKVLRLQKAVKNDRNVGNAIGSKRAPVLSPEEQKIWAEWPGLVSATAISELNHVYARDVLRPLLGEQHVDPGMLVCIGRSFIKAIACRIVHKRPESRVESGTLETLTDVGVVISDHTRFPTLGGVVKVSPTTISVELKPKCGFLPTTPMINEESSVKRRISRFTMHQQLKVYQGKIEQISKYDPLDLFSGTREGILKAIGALFETPQNNLRIFSNGDEVFGTSRSDKRSISHFDDVLEGFVPAQPGERVQAFQRLVADCLLKSDILCKLLAVQRRDYYDIEGAIQAYDKFLRYHERGTEKSRNDGNPSSRRATEDLRQFEFDYQVEARQRSEKQSILSSASVEDCRKILQDFLIAATAKDCGLMLTLQRFEMDRDGVNVHNSNMFSFLDADYLQKEILLLDLDCKRLKKMNYYLQLDQEIVQAYKSITS